MSKTIKIRRGLDIKLKGKAKQLIEDVGQASTYAIKPSDFQGLKPKLSVSVNDEVKAGTPLFFDKNDERIQFCSPVSGTIKSINRGERRKILEVVIEANGSIEYKEFTKTDPSKLSENDIKELLLNSGLWPFITQRPFGTIANPDSKPRDIFVSAFDSSPLAPDYEFIFKDDLAEIQTGIDLVSKLTSGNVYVGLPDGTESIFANLKNVSFNSFNGPHPAGNVGIQIHKVKPINKGETVWTLSLQSLVYIGRLINNGKHDVTKKVALTGSEVKEPKYVNVISGVSIESIIKGKTLAEKSERIISGNVLTGTQIDSNNFIGFKDNQITIIPEGNEIQAFGWIDPGFTKYSPTSTFLSKLFPKKEYKLNANLHGGERAFVVSEQYEKYLPMDIYPVFLLKAILANDFDKMEQLGMYEVIEEDLALCEYACTSKIEVQQIIRQGIDMMLKELA